MSSQNNVKNAIKCIAIWQYLMSTSMGFKSVQSFTINTKKKSYKMLLCKTDIERIYTFETYYCTIYWKIDSKHFYSLRIWEVNHGISMSPASMIHTVYSIKPWNFHGSRQYDMI